MKFNPVTEDVSFIDPNHPSSMTPVILNSRGSKLLGTMFLAGGNKLNPTVLLLHGFPGNENNFDIAHAVRRNGFNVLVFYYRGSWGSEGEFSWKSCLEDVETAVEFLKDKKNSENYSIDTGKIILVGHSLGGFAAIYTLAKNNFLKYGASLAGFNFGFFAELIKSDPEIKKAALEKMEAGAQIVKNTSADKLLEQMLSYSKDWDLRQYAGELSRKSTLFIGAKYDMIASEELHQKPLVDSIKKKDGKLLTCITLETGHSFTDKRIKLTQIIIDWLNKLEF